MNKTYDSWYEHGIWYFLFKIDGKCFLGHDYNPFKAYTYAEEMAYNHIEFNKAQEEAYGERLRNRLH